MAGSGFSRLRLWREEFVVRGERAAADPGGRQVGEGGEAGVKDAVL